MKRILPILLVVLVAGAAYAVYSTTKSSSAAAQGLGGSGTIEATNVNVSSQAQGAARIIEVDVKTGDQVKKGQVLFKLDPTLANLTVQQAQAGVTAAAATLKQDKDDSKSDAQIAQDQATLDQANIQVKMAQAQLSYYTIKAPIDGAALDVPGTVGQNAAPGSTLAVIGDVGHLTVSIYVPESQIGQVKVDQKGTLTTDSTGNQTFPCTVTSVASQAEFTPASIETKDQRVKLVYQVQLDVHDTTGALKPGMPADVTLQ